MRISKLLPGWSLAAILLAGAAATVAVSSGAQTPAGPGPSTSSKTPGATGDVSGQTPAQAQQAQRAPIQPSTTGDSYAGWWAPGSGQVMPPEASFDNPEGKIGLLNTGGPIDTKGHPFFEPMGSNGRACVSCHQPEDGMSISAATVAQRWKDTNGKDPIFAAVDGSNCPSLPQDQAASHSLLLNRGLFRIFLPWPPKAADGTTMKPEFDLEVVSDPTGCNTDPVYGVHSAHPMVSVFRRPRVVANMKYVTFGYGNNPFNIKDGSPMARDPDTGKFVNMNIMADSREPTQRTQAVNAALTHEQADHAPSQAQLQQIVNFENQIYVAENYSTAAGNLEEAGGPIGLGPHNMAHESPGLGDNFYTPVFGYFEQWKPKSDDDVGNAQAAFRASVARGMEIYFTRAFYIRDVTHLNTVGLGNPIKRTCATCHNAKMTGMDTAPGWMDIGTQNQPWSRILPTDADLPLFKLTCHSDKPHPFLGDVIYTHDPGRALISGRCVDIGAITMQQFRGLAGRAPYFSNGSAKDLRALVDYYNTRFDINYTEQEKRDLVNFLSVL